jgi:hypothetical protein
VDAWLAGLVDGLAADAAAQALAAVSNRAAVRLHNLSRAEAAARKGAAEWPAWAALQNAARSAVLQSSTCRDLARRLPPTPPAAESPPSPASPPSPPSSASAVSAPATPGTPTAPPPSKASPPAEAAEADA